MRDTDTNGCATLRGRQILISGNLDKTITIRNLATAAMSSTLFGKFSSNCSHNGYVYWVGFSPQDDILASSSADKSIRLWNWQKGKLIKTLLGHEDKVCQKHLAPMAKLLLVVAPIKVLKSGT
ncbi:MAG: hypothetical protein GDA56_01555 [Hormoscilla sp. GM7CHS1pb]|nr:hypothetical protein [Hormoscilla sp. GM7CHS1pb]